jgi:DNA-binding MarR family transcriptional regulator
VPNGSLQIVSKQGAEYMLDNGDAVLEWLRRIFWSVVRNGDPDLTTRQLALLLLAQDSLKPIGLKEVAMTLKIPKPSVTRAIDRLQFLQLIDRRPSSEGGKQLTLHLSGQGENYIQMMRDNAALHPVPAMG